MKCFLTLNRSGFGRSCRRTQAFSTFNCPAQDCCGPHSRQKWNPSTGFLKRCSWLPAVIHAVGTRTRETTQVDLFSAAHPSTTTTRLNLRTFPLLPRTVWRRSKLAKFTDSPREESLNGRKLKGSSKVEGNAKMKLQKIVSRKHPVTFWQGEEES